MIKVANQNNPRVGMYFEDAVNGSGYMTTQLPVLVVWSMVYNPNYDMRIISLHFALTHQIDSCKLSFNSFQCLKGIPERMYARTPSPFRPSSRSFLTVK